MMLSKRLLIACPSPKGQAYPPKTLDEKKSSWLRSSATNSSAAPLHRKQRLVAKAGRKAQPTSAYHYNGHMSKSPINFQSYAGLRRVPLARSISDPDRSIVKAAPHCRPGRHRQAMVFQAKPLSKELQYVSDSIRVVPGFPKEGIMFQDITTLARDPKAFKLCIDAFVQRYQGQGIDVIAGIEARGFIFGPPIALALGVGFVPLRKPGKLPGETIGAEYQLEYGTDRIEMTVESVKAGQKVLIVDDLIATGGTLGAAVQLMEKVGAKVHEAACVIELPELQGRAKLQKTNIPLFVLLEKEA